MKCAKINIYNQIIEICRIQWLGQTGCQYWAAALALAKLLEMVVGMSDGHNLLKPI